MLISALFYFPKKSVNQNRIIFKCRRTRSYIYYHLFMDIHILLHLEINGYQVYNLAVLLRHTTKLKYFAI